MTLKSVLMQKVAGRAARGYVVGPLLDNAVLACRRLRQADVPATIAAWNETDDRPDDILAKMLDAVDAIAADGLDCYVSFKGLDLAHDPALITRIARHAGAKRVGLHFDTMTPQDMDATLNSIDVARDAGAGAVGVTIPARWQRSVGDAAHALSRGLRIRIVKGQFPDVEEPRQDLSESFLRIVDAVADAPSPLAIATHDPLLLDHVLDRLSSRRAPTEAELLFGLPMGSALSVIRARNTRVRLYIPYGTAWLPYAVAQLKRNPKLLYWLTRDMLSPRRENDLRLVMGAAGVDAAPRRRTNRGADEQR